VGPLVNPRHELAKERGWAENPPSVDEFVREVLADPNVIRRPVLVLGKKVIVGFTKSNALEWAKLG